MISKHCKANILFKYVNQNGRAGVSFGFDTIFNTLFFQTRSVPHQELVNRQSSIHQLRSCGVCVLLTQREMAH